jgi:hypothetical protein
MTQKTILPSWKYSAEMKRFQDEVEQASVCIDKINQMSQVELENAAKDDYMHGVATYERMLAEVRLHGEDYEGHQDELLQERASITLLSASEWKEKKLKDAQSRKTFYQDEALDVSNKYQPSQGI